MPINRNMNINTNARYEIKVIDGETYVFIINEIAVNKNYFEQRKIAEILGCTSVIKFVFDEGSTFEGQTVKQLMLMSIQLKWNWENALENPVRDLMIS